MNFLRPARSPLRLTNFPFSANRPATTNAELLALLKTTALVESRADAYADYLRAVFAPRGGAHRQAIDQWNREERQHGLLLRQMVEACDPYFDFDRAMRRYLAKVPYHNCDGRSVRGSIAAELVARCVVEALASTHYRVLMESVDGKVNQVAMAALAQDEARHFGMFSAMFKQEQGTEARLSRYKILRVALGRMLELSDQQILGAYAIVRSRSGQCSESWLSCSHAAALYSRYRWRHLRFAARLLMPVLLGQSSRPLECLFTVAMRIAVLYKAATARLGLLWAALPLRTAPEPGRRRLEY